MRYENTVQWALAAQLGEVYRGCANATSVDELIERVQAPLGSWLGIDVISLALADEPSVIVASNCPITPEFIERIQSHGARCIEGKGKTARAAEDIVVQQVGSVSEAEPIDADTSILWTGALESGGRLLAVITFYRTQSHQVSPLELTALRQIRSLISDTVVRIIEASAFMTEEPAESERSEDIQSDVVVIGVKDARLIAQAFGPDRVREVQNQIIGRLSGAYPHAFLIARLGFDRVIIIDHPGNGLTIDAWTKRCIAACKDIEIGPGVNLEIGVEIGEVQTGSSINENSPVNRTQEIKSPKDINLDVLAG